MLDGPGTVPLPPVEVAVGDPAAMLARRPDIRAAAQRLHAANAGIGVAEAARMPRVSLAGVVGLGGALQIGRASGRERVCQYVYISVVAGALKKKKKKEKK